MCALLTGHVGGLGLLGNISVGPQWLMAISSANRWSSGRLHLALIARNEKGELRSRVAEYFMGRRRTGKNI